MPFNIFYGHGRKTLVGTVSVSIPGSTALGVFDCNQFSRFTGYVVAATGSMTVRYRLGVSSGTYEVSSSFTVNSGPQTFDITNLGKISEWTITAANSQTGVAFCLLGEPMR